MSKQQIVFSQEAKEKLKLGINKLADAVVCTLGPAGRNVLIEKDYNQVVSTKDGVSVAKSINLPDPLENVGVSLIKQAAIKTLENSGDGTTTSTLLAREIINEGLIAIKAGSNAVEVKRGIEKATDLIIKELERISIDIKDENQLKQVASISANNDEEIGNLVATAIDRVGKEGIVTVEESKSGETSLEVVEGIQFDRGYKSHHFVTNQNNMSAVLNDVFILIYDRKINQVKDLLPLLENLSNQNKSLLIIAEDIDGEALAVLIVNKIRGIIKVAAIKAPDYGERRTQVLEDIAILTGGQVISKEKGMLLEHLQSPEGMSWLGEARTVTVTKDTTTIVDGKGDENEINTRLLSLQEQINSAQSPFEVEKIQERLARVAGGVALINVGGVNDIDIKEKKDRVEDALNATKAAIEQGILPGGGIALLQARKVLIKEGNWSVDQGLGLKLVFDAACKPFIQILLNCGYSLNESHSLMYELSCKKNIWQGFDAKLRKKVNMLDAGIVDPTKVTKNALKNAVSIASTVLITECVIHNEKEKQTQPDLGY